MRTSRMMMLGATRGGKANTGGAGGGGGGGWSFPNTSGGTLGPGANAPAWSGKTTYPGETFDTPIPVHYASANARGFKGYQGFDGAWGATYNPTRVVYPTVDVLGVSRPVLEVRYNGSTKMISGAGQTTDAWPIGYDEPCGVRIFGTWSGTLVFETSIDDGESWQAVTMEGTHDISSGTVADASSTTANGVWGGHGDGPTSGLFRVRASSWGSGTAEVRVGMRGGAAAARAEFGAFTGTPTRIYCRALYYVDPAWNDGNNTGTKFLFATTVANGYGHYFGAHSEAGTGVFIGLQQKGTNRNMTGNVIVPNGQFVDLEYVLESNTPGVANGIAKAWVNGQLAIDESDVLFFVSGDTPGFSGMFYDPTYGGGEAPPPLNTFVRIAGIYQESAA